MRLFAGYAKGRSRPFDLDVTASAKNAFDESFFQPFKKGESPRISAPYGAAGFLLDLPWGIT